jgi:cytochrome c biogenesis protein CcmG/thiol:disulfide interchange protein DsbE
VDDRPGLALADFRWQAAPAQRLRQLVRALCAVESPQLAALAQQGVEIDGVAIRDRREDVAQFLSANGNPFRRIGKDDLSKVQLAIGSSGVPETFVIDGKGVIRYQHIGDIRAEDVPLILRKLKEAES